MPGADVDLSVPRRIHVVGVGGSGMSAIASVLAAMGHTVTGSDLKESAALERLRAQGIEVHVGHDADHLDTPDLVTRSTAVGDSNPEVVMARSRDIPVLRRASILAAITATRPTIAVSGTHGKTTTSSMLALILVEAGLRPSFIIGGDVNEVGAGAVWGDGEWLVVEADESDGTFVELDADVSVTTNVEPDHLEHYGGFDGLLDAFDRFVGGGERARVVCIDDEHAAALAARHGAVTYGTAPEADYRVSDVESGRARASFRLTKGDEELGPVELPIPGRHNVMNAAGALATALEIGAPFEAGRVALGRFGGVARRFEYRGEAAGVTFVDDYAHLPTEVCQMLGAASDGGWSRIVCVFQPHRYSRIDALWHSFADAFDDADLLVVTDIYPAGEAPRPGVSGKLVVDAALDARPWRRVAYLPDRADLVSYLTAELRPGDLCVTLGAGDLTTLPDEVQAALAERS